MTPSEPQDSPSASYWYPEVLQERELLRAVRRLQRAHEEMRRRACAEAGLNSTDMTALRLVIAAERSDAPLTAAALAAQLDISSASTAKLLNRLTAAGHLRRVRHPRDGRSVTVSSTPAAHEQLRAIMTGAHDRMLAAAQHVPPESRQAVLEFLAEMTAAMEPRDQMYETKKDCDD